MEGRPLEESQLVERARHGDAVAYEGLVQRHQQVAFRAAYLILGDAPEAEDATQEGFVRAYYALSRFRAGEPFRPWVLRIVVNAARNRRKAASRRAALALRAGEDRGPGEAAPSPETAVLAREERAAILAALAGLREEERLTVAYRYFLDLSEAEIAATLAISAGSVKTHASRGIAALAKTLEGEYTR